jgi:hypothetical protein
MSSPWILQEHAPFDSMTLRRNPRVMQQYWDVYWNNTLRVINARDFFESRLRAEKLFGGKQLVEGHPQGGVRKDRS